MEPQRIREVIVALPLAIETRNHYLVACKSFSRWLWKEGVLPSDRLIGLSRWNAEPFRVMRRRALAFDELCRLIRATESSPRDFRGLSGYDRAALYLLASYSGLRVSELASLTKEDLSLDQFPVVTIRAAYSKHKRQDTLPLPQDVAEYLKGWLEKKTLSTPKLFPGTWVEKGARMIRLDLREAGIEEETLAGRVDFHSLRVTYATLLAKRGINLQIAQTLLRHSDPKLTARTYTRLGIADLAGVIDQLPVPSAIGDSNL